MRRTTWLTVLLLAASGLLAARVHHEAARRTASDFTMHDRLHRYRQHTIGRGALVQRAGSTALTQAMGTGPHQWHGATGFAKRFGSSLATHAIKGGIEMGVEAWHHEDPRYYRSSGKHGFFPRLKYAAVNTVMVHRTGGRPGKTVAAGRISGAVGAGLISRTWQPAAVGVGSGVASGGVMLGADFAENVAKEFWPRHHKRVAARQVKHGHRG